MAVRRSIPPLLVLTAWAVSSAQIALARRMVQDDAPGTVLTGPHTEEKTYPVAGNGGCQTFETTPDRAAFNFTSTITYAVLPSGCSANDLQVTKVYARGACAKTRANNYAVKSLGIVNDPSCAAVAGNDTATCTATFAAAPSKAVVNSPASGDQIDSGEVCWPAPFVYVFVKNTCATPISVTVTNLFNSYDGACIEGDGDDGDAAATASNSGGDVSTNTADSGGSGLSTGAKAGIAIGVIAAVVTIVGTIVFFCCCQLRK